MKRLFCVLTVVCALGLITFQSLARAQEKIKVMSDGPLRPAFEQITEAFRRQSWVGLGLGWLYARTHPRGISLQLKHSNRLCSTRTH